MSSRESDTDCTTNTDTEDVYTDDNDEEKSRCSTCESESSRKEEEDDDGAVFYEDLMSSNDSGSDSEKINSVGEPAVPVAAVATAATVTGSNSEKKRKRRTEPSASAKVPKTSLPSDPLASTRQLLETLVQELVSARQSTPKPPIAAKATKLAQQSQQQQPPAGSGSGGGSSKAKKDLVKRLQTLDKNFEAAHQRLRDLQKLVSE